MLKKVLDNRGQILYNEKVIRGVTQFGRVLGLGPRCRRFKSCRPDQRGVPTGRKISANICGDFYLLLSLKIFHKQKLKRGTFHNGAFSVIFYSDVHSLSTNNENFL